MRKRELEVLGEELLDVRAANAVGFLDFGNAENLIELSAIDQQTSREVVTDVNGAETGTVTRGHILVQRLDRVGSGHLTELLVHVVGTGARVVTEPDSEVLDLLWALLVDLYKKEVSLIGASIIYSVSSITYHIEADDLTVGLLHLLELHQEVPKAGLGHNSVGRKDAHAVQLRRRVRLGGQMTPDDLVLVETPCKNTGQSQVQELQKCIDSARFPVRSSHIVMFCPPLKILPD